MRPAPNQAKQLTEAEAYQKITSFCAYQDRARNEVRGRLQQYGLSDQQINQIMNQLQEEGYINEERFARNFAGSKFRSLHWGRVKIRQVLRLKGVPAALIIQAMAEEISDEAYETALQTLLERKAATLKNSDEPQVRRRKLLGYALSKGYESELVTDALQLLP